MTSRTIASRTVALLVVAILVGPAVSECAGLASAGSGHACCANLGGLASETTLTPCCGRSDQSNDTAPPETQAAGPSLKLLAPHFAAFADPGAIRAPIPVESFAARRAAVVPLYLQQASLLI